MKEINVLVLPGTAVWVLKDNEIVRGVCGWIECAIYDRGVRKLYGVLHSESTNSPEFTQTLTAESHDIFDSYATAIDELYRRIDDGEGDDLSDREAIPVEHKFGPNDEVYAIVRKNISFTIVRLPVVSVSLKIHPDTTSTVIYKLSNTDTNSVYSVDEADTFAEYQEAAVELADRLGAEYTPPVDIP